MITISAFASNSLLSYHINNHVTTNTALGISFPNNIEFYNKMSTIPNEITTESPLVSSSIHLGQSDQVFEAVLPDTSALVAMGSILILSVIAAVVWSNEVVPVSRTKLAISKSRGEVKEYLNELKDDTAMEGDRNFEKWLFADWLRNNKSAKKPSAVPFLKDAKWNSGDNPVLVTSGLLLLCVVLASITERAGMMGVR